MEIKTLAEVGIMPKRKGMHIWELVGKHFDYVMECFLIFETFVADFLAGKNFDVYNEEFHTICELEGAADRTRRELVDTFLEGALLPGTRSEILNIVSRTDKIANLCEDVSRQLVIEQVRLPEFLNNGLLEILTITKEQMDKLSSVLDKLFGNYEQLIYDKFILRDLDESESKVDKIEVELIKSVFASEELSLAEKTHCRFFISRIADISDMIEDISDEIQIMLVFRKV